MTDEQSEKLSKLKPYQIILISCLLCSILVVNSNSVNKNRDLAKLNKQKEELFDSIIQRRILQSKNYSEDVCSRASDDLIEYYKTGDLSKIDIDGSGSIECKNKDSGYMKALISIVRAVSGDDKEDSNDVDDTGYRDRLRNLEDLNTDDLLDYSLDRILPMAVFLVFGILGFIGWIVCCFCCCFNCCCCCCCKKKTCKLPCFVFTYIFYALVIVVCIYGLSQTNKIFVGLANTECSFLKFFDQVVDGEMKQETPRWAGINIIQGLLDDISNTLTELDTRARDQLNADVNIIRNSRTTFNNTLHETYKKFYDESTNTYKTPYKEHYSLTDKGISGDYIYDTVYLFGKYDSVTKEYQPSTSFLLAWNQEFSLIDEEAFGYLETTQKGFDNILGSKLGTVQDALQDGRDKLDELLEPFNDIKDDAGKALYDVSDLIDQYGKMGVNIVFGVLMAMNLALAVLMILISLCSGKSCAGCCCCRCLFKFCTHILWNVLALLMIFAFLIGSFVALIGRLGGDMMGILSYVMSIDNFNGTDPILLGELGEAKDYIYTCMHGDGDIAKQLNLGSSLDSFEDINSVEGNISTALDNFTRIKDMTPTYNFIKNRLESQLNYTEETSMVIPPKKGETPSSNPEIKYSDLLEEINKVCEENNWKKWSKTENEYTCSSTPSGTDYYPRKCKYSDTTYYGNDEFKKYAKILESMDKIVEYANSKVTESGKAENVMKVIDDLKDNYNNYLEGYVRILQFFLTTIQSLTGLIRQYIGNGNAFSFLNGKFIGTNLKIILKYLEHSLGGDFYTVGICLCIVGLSLILSISSTILLIVIINIELKENQDEQRAQNNRNNVNKGLAVSEFTSNHPVQNAY